MAPLSFFATKAEWEVNDKDLNSACFKKSTKTSKQFHGNTHSLRNAQRAKNHFESSKQTILTAPLFFYSDYL